MVRVKALSRDLMDPTKKRIRSCRIPLRELNQKRLITMTRDKYDSPSFFDECTGPISE